MVNQPVDTILAGAAVVLVISGLPSSGDLGVLRTSRYWSYTQAWQADIYRAAEGVP